MSRRVLASGLLQVLVVSSLLVLTGCGSSAVATTPLTRSEAARVLAPEDCESATWTSLVPDSWLADCTNRLRDGVEHRLFTVRGRSTAPLIRYVEDPSARVPESYRIEVHGSRVTLHASTEFDEVDDQTWDVAAQPPRLVQQRKGGGRLCWMGVVAGGNLSDSRTNNLVAPLCTTDLVAGSRHCARDHIDCSVGGALGDCGANGTWVGCGRYRRREYLAIPVHMVGARLRSSLRDCAAELGRAAWDVVSPERRANRPVAVAVDDQDNEKLRLDLYAPLGAPRGHWELWLASVCDEGDCNADPGPICITIRGLRSEHFVVAMGSAGDQPKIVPVPGSPTTALHDLQVRIDAGKTTLTLASDAYRYAHAAGITIGYRDGASLVASSAVADEQLDSLGRLDDGSLCDSPEQLPTRPSP